MVVPSLPLEIHREITQLLQSKKDILSVISTNSTFCEIGQGVLYRCFDIDIITGSHSVKRTVQWCRAIINRPRLAAAVRELKLFVSLDFEPFTIGGSAHRLIVRALDSVRNLQILRVCWMDSSEFWMLDDLHFPNLRVCDAWGLSTHLEPPDVLPQHPFLTVNLGEGEDNSLRIRDGPFTHLRQYWGSIHNLTRFGSTLHLQSLAVHVHSLQDAQALATFLQTCGKRVRALDLAIEPLDIAQVLVEHLPALVPDLQELILSGNACAERIKATVGKTISRLFYLMVLSITHSRFGCRRPSEDLEVEGSQVASFHAMCPTLRVIGFVRLHNQRKTWRYHVRKKIWMPPVWCKTWWRVPENEVLLADYDNIKERYF